MPHLGAESSPSAFRSLVLSPVAMRMVMTRLVFSLSIMEVEAFGSSAPQPSVLGWVARLSSVFLKPACASESAGEFFTAPLTWPDATPDLLNQTPWGGVGSVALGPQVILMCNQSWESLA